MEHIHDEINRAILTAMACEEYYFTDNLEDCGQSIVTALREESPSTVTHRKYSAGGRLAGIDRTSYNEENVSE